MTNSITEILKTAKINVAPETFAIVSLTGKDWNTVLADPEASPRMSVPFMIFKDRFETTLVLDEIDLASLRSAAGSARIENGFRLLTFDVELDFSVTGFIAEISRVLAEAKIPIVAVSSFSRDHLLIRQNDLASALRALRPVVDEVC
ncbi:MAG: ACT domain-containing protein [Acidobacteria bacterium]|nr:ACT domain-containing protein [Acidobacteriota bacterium]